MDSFLSKLDLLAPKILSDLARVVGVPLRIDKNTVHGEFGKYARLLVDIDLTDELPAMILLNKEGKEMEVPLWYENLPFFCQECKSIGHQRSDCNKLIKECFNEAPAVNKQEIPKEKGQNTFWRKKGPPREEVLPGVEEEPTCPEIVVERGECSKGTKENELLKFTHHNPFEGLACEDLEEDTFKFPEGEGVEEDQLSYGSESEHTKISEYESEEERANNAMNICMDAKSAGSSKKKKKWKRGRLTKTERRKRLQSMGMSRPRTRASSNPSQ